MRRFIQTTLENGCIVSLPAEAPRRHEIELAVQVSQAASLKRIADAFEMLTDPTRAHAHIVGLGGALDHVAESAGQAFALGMGGR